MEAWELQAEFERLARASESELVEAKLDERPAAEDVHPYQTVDALAQADWHAFYGDPLLSDEEACHAVVDMVRERAAWRAAEDAAFRAALDSPARRIS